MTTRKYIRLEVAEISGVHDAVVECKFANKISAGERPIGKRQSVGSQCAAFEVGEGTSTVFNLDQMRYVSIHVFSKSVFSSTEVAALRININKRDTALFTGTLEEIITHTIEKNPITSWTTAPPDGFKLKMKITRFGQGVPPSPGPPGTPGGGAEDAMPTPMKTYPSASQAVYEDQNKLTVEIYNAIGLKDVDNALQGKSDPRVRVKLGKEEKYTRTVDDNLDPEWNQKMEFYVTDRTKPLELIVEDEDHYGFTDISKKYTFMGKVNIDLEQLLLGEEVNTQF